MKFEGLMTAIVTPMQGGSIDEAGLREVAQFDASYLYGEGDLAPGSLDDG